jgi:D-arabinose 1-dehydrogenase-like Zn-dependent alcohol dehydrogenase
MKLRDARSRFSPGRKNTMRKMKAVEVKQAGAPLELVERDVPEPGEGHVLIRIQACGICHSDVMTKEGLWPGMKFPRVPGHEIAGVIDSVGKGVEGWEVGQRVGVGWHGGHCGKCEHCRQGDFVLCKNALVPGISYDGGYAEYMVAPVEALAHIPDDLSDVDAAPLLCAGITTFNALRNSGARGGDVVAILGIGGLGHLVLLCHKFPESHRASAAWAYVETGDKPHGELIANGGERIRRVALRAHFPSQCNLREHQVSGVLRSFFWR